MRRPEDDLRNVEELCVRFGMSPDEGAKLVWLEHQLNLAKRYEPRLSSDLQEARAELERVRGHFRSAVSGLVSVSCEAGCWVEVASVDKRRLALLAEILGVDLSGGTV